MPSITLIVVAASVSPRLYNEVLFAKFGRQIACGAENLPNFGSESSDNVHVVFQYFLKKCEFLIRFYFQSNARVCLRI